MARPVRVFTEKDREEIAHLAGLCMSHDEIAILKKCSRDTLEKHCKEELAEGKANAKSLVTKGLFGNIKAGKEASIFFYLKTQHGWREKSEIEHSGSVQLQTVINFGTKPESK